MPNVPDRADITKWLIDLLKADPDGFEVGDHRAPAAAGYPYWTVWGIPGGGASGPPLGASQADAAFAFQVDAVGQTREQSERLAGRSRDRVAGRGPNGAYSAAAANPPGAVVNDRILDGGPGAPLPEGTYPNEVWTTSERFVIYVSAS